MALGRTARTMVLSEDSAGAGLTLLRVLRKGLELDSCLGKTASGRDVSVEDCLPHRSSGDSTFQELEGHGAPHAPRTMKPLYIWGRLSWVGSKTSPGVNEGERGELASQRDTGELLEHPALEHAVDRNPERGPDSNGYVGGAPRTLSTRTWLRSSPSRVRRADRRRRGRPSNDS